MDKLKLLTLDSDAFLSKKNNALNVFWTPLEELTAFTRPPIAGLKKDE